jgi:hypothetical protein
MDTQQPGCTGDREDCIEGLSEAGVHPVEDL